MGAEGIMGGVKLLAIPFRCLRHRVALWQFNRNVRNPQFLLTSEPGPEIHIMVKERYLSAPLVGGAFLTRPFTIYNGHEIRSVNRLGIYKLGRFQLHVVGRVSGKAICPSEVDLQKGDFLVSTQFRK